LEQVARAADDVANKARECQNLAPPLREQRQQDRPEEEEEQPPQPEQPDAVEVFTNRVKRELKEFTKASTVDKHRRPDSEEINLAQLLAGATDAETCIASYAAAGAASAAALCALSRSKQLRHPQNE
jgi:hypothetical protein